MVHVFILIIILAVVTIMTQYLTRLHGQKKYRCFLELMFLMYVGGYLYFVFFSRKPTSETKVNLVPFQTYKYLLAQEEQMQRFSTSFRAIGLESSSPLVGVFLNILLLYPLGFFLPILFPKLKFKHVMLIGCLCSSATEAVQYILKIGWCEIDDVLHNTLGVAIGGLIWCLQAKQLNDSALKRSEQE